MPTSHRLASTRFSLAKIACVIFVFCAATAIASPAQTLTTLASFDFTDGAYPTALMQAADGNFYGTTVSGGAPGAGTVFKITPSGTLSTLHSFDNTDGASPHGLVQGSDGNFYGTTAQGGAHSQGTVFTITPSGALTTLHSFDYGDGAGPTATLVQGTDGSFYGTASSGGANGHGTVFKITPQGTLITLHSFNGADGSVPEGALVQGTDGNFYGTTPGGGTVNNSCPLGCGTVFKITSSGALTTLHSFDLTDGSGPTVGLMQATDGSFYGTTPGGGPINNNCTVLSGCGTIFKITPSGTLTTLYGFCTQPNCADGYDPDAVLVQGTDGNFYGTASQGGNPICGGGMAGGCGTVFRITPSGTLTTLYSFDGTAGYAPTALVQAGNGSFYGTTAAGGTDNVGTVYSLTGPSPTPVQFVPVPPCRLADTRQTHDPIEGGTFQFFVVPHLGGCSIPATSAAYSLNVTVVPQHPLGYLTIWPSGKSQPGVSTMNSTDGRVKANAAIVPAGASGAVSVYASNTTDVILDIDGYFATPSSQTYQFYPLTPCRIVDTRNNQDGGMLQAGVERDYAIPPNCGVPNNATAYSFNVTVLPSAGGLDYLTVWPEGESRPTVSTLNDNTGTIVANAAIVPAGSENATAFYAHSNNTNLLLDVDGYFAAPGTGGLSLYPLTPCRVLDTRQVGNGQPFMGIWNPPNGVDVLTSQCAPPSTAKGFVFNATVVPSGSMPYLTLWPHGEGQPGVSTLNAYDGFITSNMAIVPTNDGSIDAYAAGLTQLILDISGYFAP